MTTTPLDCTSLEQLHAVAARAFRPGGLTVIEIQHDDGCPRSPCVCDPDVLLVDLTSGEPVVRARLLAPTPAGASA